MINWKVVELERQPIDDLVKIVHWIASLSEEVVIDEVAKTFNFSVYGSLSLERGDTFIDFDQLTEEIVIEWVKQRLGEEEVSRYENILQEQINNQKSPPIIKGIPW